MFNSYFLTTIHHTQFTADAFCFWTSWLYPISNLFWPYLHVALHSSPAGWGWYVHGCRQGRLSWSRSPCVGLPGRYHGGSIESNRGPGWSYKYHSWRGWGRGWKRSKANLLSRFLGFNRMQCICLNLISNLWVLSIDWQRCWSCWS